MDAEFLRLHVNEALLEALTATAIANPHDKIDYLGNYLVQYVHRNKMIRQKEHDAAIANDAADCYEMNESRGLAMAEVLKNDAEMAQQNLEKYIIEFADHAPTKQVAIDVFCKKSAEYLNVPAVYFASKSRVDETDILSYLSANTNSNNNTQQFMVGKQLIKYDGEDNDDKPERQGLSFNVFNLPEGQNEEGDDEEEIEDEEEENDDIKNDTTNNDDEDEENGNNKGKKIKIPFKLPSLVIENVMRNKDIKFFGIPKLGSLVIVPLSYKSTDHDTGCKIEIDEPIEEEVEEGGEEQEEGEGEGEEKISIKKEKLKPTIKYNPNPVNKEYIFAADTIGDYKPFQPQDVAWLERIGAKLMSTLERFDKEQFNRHIECLEQAQIYESIVSKIITQAEEEELKALETIEKRFAPPSEENEEQEEQEEEQAKEEEENAEEGEEGKEKEGEKTDGGDEEIKKDKDKEEVVVAVVTAPEPIQEIVYVETEEPHELLKPYRAAQAVEQIWKKCLMSEEMITLLYKLSTYELPPPGVILTLYQVFALFLDIPTSKYKDLFNNISWNVIVDECMIGEIKNNIQSYDCSQPILLSSSTTTTASTTPAENSLEFIKEQCETNALFESSTYSSVIASEGICAILRPLYLWLQKAILAREAAMMYYSEAKEINLERTKV